jgi:hypothetical protein
MTRFLKNILRFLATFIVIIGILIVAAIAYVRKTPIKIDPKKHILFVGDSHTECAINDGVFLRAANYSSSAMPFIYTYARMKKIIADNSQIDTVVLSFHSASLDYSLEDRWIFEESLLKLRVPALLPYLAMSDWFVFARDPVFYKAAMTTPKISIEYWNSRKKSETALAWLRENMGHFRALEYSHLKRDVKSRVPYEQYKMNDTISDIQLRYIRKISAFCRANNKVFILINTPVFQPQKFTGYIAYRENREKYFPNELYLDYSDFPIPDSMFADVSHLNSTGARLFSRYLAAHFSQDVKKQNGKSRLN